MIFNPAHPGEVLKDYLGGMTIKEAAARLRVTRATLSRILNRHAESRHHLFERTILVFESIQQVV
jgi:plasmid maintenance system antidote protein VapI